MGKPAGIPSVSPYDGKGGRCSYCQVNIPRERFSEEVYQASQGSYRHKYCSCQIRLYPRVSGTRRNGVKGKLRREQQIKRIE